MSLQNRQVSAKKLQHTRPAEKERMASAPQNDQLEKMPKTLLPKTKGTEPSVQITRY